MKSVFVLVILFVGTTVTAPQGQAQYQQKRPIYNLPNYGTPTFAGVPASASLTYVEPASPKYQPIGSINKLNEQSVQPRVPPAIRRYQPTVPDQPVISRYQPTQPPAQPPIPQYQPATRIEKPYIAILSQSQEDNFDGSFAYSYETENGISVDVAGFLLPDANNTEEQIMVGTYSYTAPDGTFIETNWYADENGFRAEGAHLPDQKSQGIQDLINKASLLQEEVKKSKVKKEK